MELEIFEKSDLDDLAKINVLIIDDNVLVHDTATKALKEIGVENIKCAQNAYYALRLCEEQLFHVVICAYNVQSDKDGFHLLEELKLKGHVNKTTILIFLSAETDEALVNSIVELQPDDFWVKPLQLKLVQKRLLHTISVKKKLYPMFSSLELGNYSKAIYYADRHLLVPDLKEHYPVIHRIKGEALLRLREFLEAEHYFANIKQLYNYGWVAIGEVKAMLQQNKIDQIHTLIASLKEQPNTRFATHDLLAHYYIEQQNYPLAYAEIKEACKLAPRNIERNRKAWDLARLNHDYDGQFQATRNIAQYAKNSIHDSPQLLLNVIRSSIDLASTITDSRRNKVIQESERFLQQLEERYDDIHTFKQQVLVAKARLHNVKEEKDKAEALVENHLNLKATTDIEDNLDKMKVFHELGKQDEALILLNAVKNQVKSNSLTSKVIAKYIEQEIDQRTDIRFTVHELHNQANQYYRNKYYRRALEALQDALVLKPNHTKLLIHSLKVLIELKKKDELTDKQSKFARDCFTLLDEFELTEKHAAVYQKLKRAWFQ